MRTQPLGQRVQVADEYAGVSLAGRAEVRLHAEVDLQPVRAHPQTTAGGERRWLGHLGHAQDVDVEPAALVLAARRDGQLHMVQTEAELRGDFGVVGLSHVEGSFGRVLSRPCHGS